MDPNATLRKIDELMSELSGSEGLTASSVAGELREACEDLFCWIQRGGFEPKWSDFPEAAGVYSAIQRKHRNFWMASL